MTRTIACLLVLACTTTVYADPGIRRMGAASRTLGCSSYTPAGSCEGINSIRLGLSVVDLSWSDGRKTALTVMFDQASRPVGGLVLSQTVAAFGVRRAFGPMWLQGGPAMAIRDVGTRTVKVTRLLGSDVSPAFIVGAGLSLPSDDERHLELAVDLASSYDMDIYQLTTSLTYHRF